MKWYSATQDQSIRSGCIQLIPDLRAATWSLSGGRFAPEIADRFRDDWI
jgi:hypothetical protein